MKYDIKIEFKDTKLLLEFINSSYNNGYLSDRTKTLDFSKDTQIYSLCKGLSNHIARIWNDEILDGTLRFIIKENNDSVSLCPCSIHYEMDNNKFSFLI